MGIDKSLTDDFPSVAINGTRYHYGRETTYGNYLVENAEYAKDYWWFEQREDLLAFLVNLPESADREWIVRRYPDWYDVTHEQRCAYMEERDAYFRSLLEEKRQNGTAEWFNVLQFDDEGSEFYAAFADSAHLFACDNIDVEVAEHDVSGQKEFLIELKTSGDKKGIFLVWRKQALTLASTLIKAVNSIDERRPQRADRKQ